jgi:site-specific DNA recombinase
MQKTILYCRKSTESDEKQIQSLNDQISEMKEFLHRFNTGFARTPDEQLKLIDTMTESFSAKKCGQRKVFNDLMTQVENGLCDCVLVWSIDRISRNVGDVERVISLLEGGQLKQIRTPSQEFKNEPFHKYMLVQAVANAKLENDQKGVNVVRGLKSKIRNGDWIGWARIGYENFGDKKGQKWVDKDESRWEVIKSCWDMFATGAYSIPQIKAHAEKMGLRARPTRRQPEGAMVGVNTYYGMFRNPFYIGKMKIGNSHNGKGVKIFAEAKELLSRGEIEGELCDDCVVVKGNHPPMISEEMFYRVQDVLKKRGLTHHTALPRIHNYLFAGAINCKKCGCATVTEEKRKYKCSCCNKWFTHSASKPLPTECPKCKEKVTPQTCDSLIVHRYVRCTGHNKNKKPCSQGLRQNGTYKRTAVEADLCQQIEDYLESLSITPEIYEYAQEMLKDEHFQKKVLENKSLKNLQKDHQLIKNKLDNLLELRLNGEIGSDVFAKKKSALSQQQDDVMRHIQKLNEKNTDWVEQADNCLNLANRAKNAWRSGSKQLKREILKSLSSNAYLNDGKIELKLRKPFDVLLIPQIDTDKEKAQKSLSVPEFSNWLPGPDSNRRPID